MAYYEYLVSSMPTLYFGMPAPFTYEKFLDKCVNLIDEEDLEMLRKIPLLEPGDDFPGVESLRRWVKFDTALRNELVKIRAGRKHIEPAKYARLDGYVDPSIAHMAMNAYRIKSVMATEKELDIQRWNFLEDISAGHYFDRDVVVIYALKLLILQRWTRIKKADGARVMEEALTEN